MKNAIDNPIVEEAVKSFNIGKISEIKKLETKGGRKAYKVTTDKGVFVIKSAAVESTYEKLEKDLYILNYLKDFNFPVPQLIKTLQDEYLIKVEGHATYSYPYIEGVHPKPSNNFFHDLGKLLAQLHLIPAENYPYKSTFTPEIELPKLRENLSRIAQLGENKEISKLIKDIDSFPSFKDLPKTIIHTDPYFSNLIQNNDQLYFIDLDDAGVAPAIIDVGYVLAHCCTTEPGDREERDLEGDGIIWHQDWAESFIEGYQNLRSLSQKEKEHLVAAASFGMLVYLPDWEDLNTISESRLERYKLILQNIPRLNIF